jgi:hypothetical protein
MERPHASIKKEISKITGRENGLREEGVWCVGHGGRGVHVREKWRDVRLKSGVCEWEKGPAIHLK